VLIDKALFPRDKVCGDACSGRTTFVIENANPAWLKEIRDNTDGFLPNWGMSIIAPNCKIIDIPYTNAEKVRTQAKGFTVPRMVLDNFLFSKVAGPYCTFLGGVAGLTITNLEDGVVVTGSNSSGTFAWKAPVIVAADGDKSTVRRSMINPVAAKPKAVGLRAYYDGVVGMHPDNFIELHFLPQLPCGYLWIFPLTGGRANVGVGMLTDSVRKEKINLRELFLQVIHTDPRFSKRFSNAVLQGKVEGWGIPIFERKMPISGNRVLLTGDAAELVDPFSGEGIGNALYSGMLAADAIVAAQTANDFSGGFFHKNYDQPVFKALGQELEQNARLQKMFNNPALFNALFNKAHKSPALMKVFRQALVQPPSTISLLNPLFLLKVLLNK
jgi:flavin-dependent dehydrogenase